MIGDRILILKTALYTSTKPIETHTSEISETSQTAIPVLSFWS